MSMSTFNNDDYMEITETGWMPVGDGCYLNKFNGHTIDQIGREYDQNGNLVYDPESSNEQH